MTILQLSVKIGLPVQTQYNQFKPPLSKKFSNNEVMEAYFLALIELYTDNLLELVEILNRFPGAEIIAKVLSLFDCPRPPIFSPSVMDFLKSIELPFCRNTSDITLPMLINPLAVLNLDILKILAEAAKEAIRRAIR